MGMKVLYMNTQPRRYNKSSITSFGIIVETTAGNLRNVVILTVSTFKLPV